MKCRPSRLVLLSGSLVLAALGVGTQARQADFVAVEQLRKEMTDAVLRALGLDDPPSLDRPRPHGSTALVASGTSGTMSRLELQVRRILGFAPAGSHHEDMDRFAAASAETGAAPAATDAASDTNVAVPAPLAEANTQHVATTAATPTSVPTAPIDLGPGTIPQGTAPPLTPSMASGPAQQPIAVALDDSALDTLRGGFIGENGLRISFGIERAVYVNGSLVTTTSLNLSELGTLSAGKGAVLSPAEVGNSIALIQNGAGNTVLSNLGPAAIGTVIQNTLDGQKIQTLTTINATVNSLSVLRSIETQRNLRSAVTDSLRR